MNLAGSEEAHYPTIRVRRDARTDGEDVAQSTGATLHGFSYGTNFFPNMGPSIRS